MFEIYVLNFTPVHVQMIPSSEKKWNSKVQNNNNKTIKQSYFYAIAIL
jgi:hypothetical protein